VTGNTRIHGGVPLSASESIVIEFWRYISILLLFITTGPKGCIVLRYSKLSRLVQ